jgi:hypothetical protein
VAVRLVFTDPVNDTIALGAAVLAAVTMSVLYRPEAILRRVVVTVTGMVLTRRRG